jgi:hypothetical protein
MFTVIQRTHKAGKQVDPTQLEQPIAGKVVWQSKYDPVTRRIQVFMEFLPSPDRMKVPKQTKLPNLLDPHVQAFDSEKGMMITGFEILNGGRHYQGWWIRWYPEMPQWYADMLTPT